MFDKYMIAEDGFRNVASRGEVPGFELKIRIPYYRGIALSLVEDLSVTVDGVKFGRDDIRFTVASGSFSMAEMETVVNHRWQFGEAATLSIRKPGGLTPGLHEVEVYQRLRISYMPVPSITVATKSLTLVA
jgi:hypothetical protein